MRKTIYTHVDPTPLRDLGEEYVEAFVTFIDILGFSELISSDSAYEVRKRLFATKFFHSVPHPVEETNAKDFVAPISIQFSDSIIRIQPIPTNKENSHDWKLQYFFSELTSILMAQGNLACNGIFVRGGMTFGKVSASDSAIFGPAYLRAYKIESTLALYPRIIIDQMLIGQLLGEKVWEDCSQYVQQDSDGQWFIQYLTHHARPPKLKD